MDAVIRSKLVYGLESVQIPIHLMSKMVAFQMRGLRKIFGLKAPFVERSNTNAHVVHVANEFRNPKNQPHKNMKLFESYISSRQQALYAHTVRANEKDPLRECTFEPVSTNPKTVTKRRVGRPRNHWTGKASESLHNSTFG